jgi:uncharacterized protein (TIGR02001 family)
MNALQRLAGGAATAFALFALTAPAFAGGSIKDKPEARRCTFSANTALTTDYVFRGFSQSKEGPAVQGGFDATCGMFYAGVWGSSIDFDIGSSMELDAYAGIKGTVGRFSYDLGIIYYGYPNQDSSLSQNVDWLEFKAGLSTEVWKGGTLGGTVFFSPDYNLETGNVWTLEGSFSQALPTIFGRVTPTFSALLGYQFSSDDKVAFTNRVTGDDSKYMYWNAGVTFGLDKNWSLDVRYWDTNINGAAATCTTLDTLSCDERVLGTLKFTY